MWELEENKKKKGNLDWEYSKSSHIHDIFFSSQNPYIGWAISTSYRRAVILLHKIVELVRYLKMNKNCARYHPIVVKKKS